MFSALLKKLRSEKNLTQGQLAKEVGVSPGNVGDWETGKSKPGYNALASLARIFEVSADYLLEIEPSPAKASDDLFNQNRAFSRSTGSGYTQNSTNSVIGRYYMVQFNYNLRRFGKKGSRNIKDYDGVEPSSGSRRMGPGGPGGPPPGMFHGPR